MSKPIVMAEIYPENKPEELEAISELSYSDSRERKGTNLTYDRDKLKRVKLWLNNYRAIDHLWLPK